MASGVAVVAELVGEVAVLDDTEPPPVGDVAPGDEDVGFSWNSFLMLIVPVGVWPLLLPLCGAGDVLPIGGNNIRMPDPTLAAAAAVAFFGCRPTAFATALMIAALEKLLPEHAEADGTGVVEPFVLLLLLVFMLDGAASEPQGWFWAYSVLWMIFTCAVMLSLRVNSLKQYGHG